MKSFAFALLVALFAPAVLAGPVDVCGGITNVQCPTGYSCVDENLNLASTGTCKLVAQSGQVCGGFTNVLCLGSLQCLDANGLPASTGTCQTPRATQGQVCGGFTNVQCVAGLQCLNEQLVPAPTGTCQIPPAKLGAACGTRGVPFTCEAGAICAWSTPLRNAADAAGVCVATCGASKRCTPILTSTCIRGISASNNATVTGCTERCGLLRRCPTGQTCVSNACQLYF